MVGAEVAVRARRNWVVGRRVKQRPIRTVDGRVVARPDRRLVVERVAPLPVAEVLRAGRVAGRARPARGTRRRACRRSSDAPPWLRRGRQSLAPVARIGGRRPAARIRRLADGQVLGRTRVSISVWRRLALAATSVVLLATSFGTASAATSYTVSLGSHGAARWTPGTSVYVNLKAMTPARGSSSCGRARAPLRRSRLAVLPEPRRSEARILAKTTRVGGVDAPATASSCASCSAAPWSAARSSSLAAPSGALHGVDLVGMEMGWTDFAQATGPVSGTQLPGLRGADSSTTSHPSTCSVITFLFSWEGMQSTIERPDPGVERRQLPRVLRQLHADRRATPPDVESA